MAKESQLNRTTGRYITIQPRGNGLTIYLNDHAKSDIVEMMEDEKKSSLDIWVEIFEDIQGNGEYLFHPNIGDSGFGMTSAEGITDGYYYEGEDRFNPYKTDYPKSAKVYWFPNYAVEDSLKTLVDDGEVFFLSADAYERGGKAGSKKAQSFIDDEEKMIDFKEMSKSDFLKSYSYLTEAEYDATAKEVEKKGKMGKGGKAGENIWAEIRNDHVDTLDPSDKNYRTRYIDAWVTGDDNEEGKVIAKVDKSGNVTYKDNRAKTDAYAQEVIQEAVEMAKNGEYKKGGKAGAGKKKSIWEALDFKSIEEYYDYIDSSRINGNFSQMERLVGDMTPDQRRGFFTYARGMGYNDTINWINEKMEKGGKVEGKKSEGEKYKFKQLHDYGEWHGTTYYAPIGQAGLYDENKDEERYVDLGIVAEILDLEEWADESIFMGQPEYRYSVEFDIVPAPHEYSKKFIKRVRESFGDEKGWDKYVAKNPLSIVDEAYRYAGGASNVNLERISVSGMEEKYGKKFQREDDFWGKVTFRRFKTGEDAEAYIKSELVSKKLQAVSGLIGFQLDQPINRIGQTGWGRLNHFILDAPYEKGGAIRTSNQQSRFLVQDRIPFNANNLSGELIGDAYVVKSYGYYPVFVYKDGEWYENENKYSKSTAKQMGQSRPTPETIKVSTEKLKELAGMAKGGKVQGMKSAWSKFWDSFASDGALITGGSYGDGQRKDFGGTILATAVGGGLGYIFGASSKQKGYSSRIMERDNKYYKWDDKKGWVEFTGEEFYALTEGNLYKYNVKEGYYQLKIFEKGGDVQTSESEVGSKVFLPDGNSGVITSEYEKDGQLHYDVKLKNGEEKKGIVARGVRIIPKWEKGGKVVPKNIKKRLEELRKEIRAERISYGEIAELQSLSKYIDPSDVELLEWAGVPEKHSSGGSMASGGYAGEEETKLLDIASEFKYELPEYKGKERDRKRKEIYEAYKKQFRKVYGAKNDIIDPFTLLDEYKERIKSSGGSMEKGGKAKLPEKGTPDWHQLQIAKKTLRMNPAILGVMGGMSVEEAKGILDKYGIKFNI